VAQTDRIIGVDESGKGDYFGPLVVAGVLADHEGSKHLLQLGARDSKKLSDNRVLAIDEAIRACFAHHVIVLSPEQYNRDHARLRNLNKILAAGHAAVISALVEKAGRGGVDSAVSDKFGKDERLEDALSECRCLIPIKQIIHGEAIAQVAAASVLARAEFLRQMRHLSDELGVELPKGAASQVDDAGQRLVELYGPEILSRVAKTHFKNNQRALAGRRLL